MKSLINVFLFCLMALSLCFCASTTKDPENPQSLPRYDDYAESEVYKDIEGEVGERDISSKNYEDDDYGDTDEEDDDELLSDVDEDDELEDPLGDEGRGQMAKVVEPLPTPKPQAKVKKWKKNKAKKLASVAPFKNGMYQFSSTCNMRSKASRSGKKVGQVKKGRRLWVEKHNQGWVKVFKKSGPVFISRDCI